MSSGMVKAELVGGPCDGESVWLSVWANAWYVPLRGPGQSVATIDEHPYLPPALPREGVYRRRSGSFDFYWEGER